MHNNEISVVCPTYNSVLYIDRAVQSIFLQSELPDEVIFSDDGSQDGTIDFLEKSRIKFESMGVDLIVLKNTHKGPGFARNQGILFATRPWIAFLDSDDEWEPDKIKRVKLAMNQEGLGVNCILHWEKYIRKSGQNVILNHGSNFNSKMSVSSQLYSKNFFSTSAITCKKSIIVKSGYFDATLPNGQDYELWLRMSPLVKLIVIHKVLGSYFEEESSITARPYYKRCISNLRIAWRHKDKAGIRLFILKIFKVLISKQWYYTIKNALIGKHSHS